MKSRVVLGLTLALFGDSCRPAPVGVEDAGPLASPTLAAVAPDAPPHEPADACAGSCARGLCWDGCAVTRLAVTPPVLALAVGDRQAAWSDTTGFHVVEAGSPSATLLTATKARAATAARDLLAWAEPSGIVRVRVGTGAPVEAAVTCKDSVRLATDGEHVAILCMSAKAGGSGVIQALHYEVSVVRADGRLIGTTTSERNPRAADPLNVLLVDEHGVTINDKDEVVRVDVGSPPPLGRKVLGKLPADFLPTDGARDGTDFEVLGLACPPGSGPEQCNAASSASLVKLDEAHTTTRGLPVGSSLLSCGVVLAGKELRVETHDGLFETVAKTVDGAAVSKTGANVVVVGGALELRWGKP